jgi:DNA-binding MarR family transcriptional regulator/GNAT superfamily N-acetyltransferase
MNFTVPDEHSNERIEAVRQFNRMYTKIIGVLDEGVLRTPYSLTEARVLVELAHQTSSEVSQLRKLLGLDAGYLSRLLAKFEADGLVARERSERDARRQLITLTPAGKDVFGMLDERSREQVRQLLGQLPEDGQSRLVNAMEMIQTQLGGGEPADRVVLRPARSGDFGWVVQRHGALYAQEYGWGPAFEALTARIVADYIDYHQPDREAAWIAQVHGEPVGSVFCVREDDTTAKLRLLLVEPAARGHGVGSALVAECISFAKAAGYRAIQLWTVDVLAAARRIYQRAGFTLVHQERGPSGFGDQLIGQTWRLELRSCGTPAPGRPA